MPELPEVETIRRDLERVLCGRVLERVEVHEPRLLQNVTPAELTAALSGRRLEAVARRGKFLIFVFGAHSAVVHLRMSGWFALRPGGHTRMVWHFRPPLYFDDVRRFGTLHLVSSAARARRPPLAGLGPEPLDEGFTVEVLARVCRGRRPLKNVLMDQTRLAGIGNIYACEILHRAGLHPGRPAQTLTQTELEGLHRAIREVLDEAIAWQGSTLGSAAGDYRTLSGARGGFQDRFRVYARAGAPCRGCGTAILGERLAGRSTYFCPRCQPARQAAALRGRACSRSRAR